MFDNITIVDSHRGLGFQIRDGGNLFLPASLSDKLHQIIALFSECFFPYLNMLNAAQLYKALTNSVHYKTRISLANVIEVNNSSYSVFYCKSLQNQSKSEYNMRFVSTNIKLC